MVRAISYLSTKASKAFTMIELIFAIVVVGVTLLTVPLMIQTNNTALERNLAQEAIFIASAVVSVASTAVWDDRSIVTTSDPDEYVLAKVLDVGIVGSQFGRTSLLSNARQGGLLENLHRQFFDYNSSAGATNAGFTPPLQSGTDTLTLVLDNSAGSISGYKTAYTINAKRMFVNDAAGVLPTAPSGVSNMKMLEVEIPLSVGDGTRVVLRAYTANIGEVDYARRSF